MRPTAEARSTPALEPGSGPWREITLAEAWAGASPPTVPEDGGDPPPGALAPLLGLVGAPPDARERQASLDLALAGAGVVGGALLEHLAGLAPGTVRIADFDRYGAGNLLTQPIDASALGRAKAEVLGRRLKRRSPSTRVLVAELRFEELTAADLHTCAALVVAGDNLALTAAASRRACELGLALFQGSVHGPTGVAQVRHTAPAAGGERACLCCPWDAGEERELERQTRFSCDGSGRSAANPAGPSGALSALGSLAGSLLAFELLRWRWRLGDGADALVEFCALSRRAVVSPLAVNRRCRVPHGAWRLVRAPRPFRELTPRQVFALAHPRSPRRLGRRSLEIEGWQWASRGQCECVAHPAVDRFLDHPVSGAPLFPCSICQRTVRVHPLHTHERAPAVLFAASSERPFAELGAASARAAIVRASSGAVLVLGAEAEAALEPVSVGACEDER